MSDERPGPPRTPLDALGVIARQDVELAPGLRHHEVYTMQGLLTLLWHEPAEGVAARDAALVLCGGAMGGLLGPAGGLYQRLGEVWAERGVPVLRVSYRRANDLDTCCLDVAATVQLAVGTGAERVVVMGHSFGGAVAVRVGVGLDPLVAGVVTFATQSAGCELAAGLHGKPLPARSHGCIWAPSFPAAGNERARFDRAPVVAGGWRWPSPTGALSGG